MNKNSSVISRISFILIFLLCFLNQSTAYAYNEKSSVIDESILPLYSEFTWNNLGAVQKELYVYDSIISLSGELYEPVERFQDETLEDVLEYYSTDNLQTLGWFSVGGAGLESTYWHSSGKYLIVKISKCIDAEDFCLSIWLSIDASSMPPEAPIEEPSSREGDKIPYPNPLQVPVFRQQNYSDILGTGTNCPTIASDGCWVTAYAMIYNYYSPGYTNPQSLNTAIKNAGSYQYNNQGCNSIMPWAPPLAPSGVSYNNAYSCTDCINLHRSKIDNELLNGRPVLAYDRYIGHMVVITGHKNGDYQINDPWDGSKNRTLSDGALGAYKPTFILFWNGTPPPPPPPPPPLVSSISRADPNPANATTVNFILNFSKPVTGVDVTDFTLTTTGISNSFVSAVSGSGTTYVVTVNTGIGDGTVRLNLSDNDTIKDTSNNIPLGGNGLGNGNFNSGQIYTIDKTPSVESINSVGTNIVNTNVIEFTVLFSIDVTGVDASDFILLTNGTLNNVSINNISGLGKSYTVTVNTGIGDGTIRLDLIDDDTILDSASNPLGGIGTTNGNFINGVVYTIDKTPPTVDSIECAIESCTSNMLNVSYLVTFSESVLEVDIADFMVVTTRLAGGHVSIVSGGGNTRVVSVSTGQGDGSIQLNFINNDTVADIAGNLIVSGLTGETYTIDKPQLSAPTLVSPSFNYVTNNTTPEFRWQLNTAAKNYEIQIDNNNDFVSPEDNGIDVITTSYTSIALTDGIYYWRVRANDVSDEPGHWSQNRSFTIDTIGPLAPTLTSPANNSIGLRTVTLRWVASEASSEYQIQVDNDIDFNSPRLELANRSASIRLPAIPIGAYYWRVRAKDVVGNWGEWSLPFVFTTK